MGKVTVNNAHIIYGIVKGYSVIENKTLIELETDGKKWETEIPKEVRSLHIGDIIGIVKDDTLDLIVNYFTKWKKKPYTDMVGIEESFSGL